MSSAVVSAFENWTSPPCRSRVQRGRQPGRQRGTGFADDVPPMRSERRRPAPRPGPEPPPPRHPGRRGRRVPSAAGARRRPRPPQHRRLGTEPHDGHGEVLELPGRPGLRAADPRTDRALLRPPPANGPREHLTHGVATATSAAPCPVALVDVYGQGGPPRARGVVGWRCGRRSAAGTAGGPPRRTRPAPTPVVPAAVATRRGERRRCTDRPPVRARWCRRRG